MTLEYIIKQAFNLGYLHGMYDAEHDTDKYTDGQAATLEYFSTELRIKSFENWDILDWKKLLWEKEHPGE